MKRITKPLKQHVGSVTIYEDDIHEIVGYLHQLPDIASITIKGDDYEFDSIDTLLQYPPKKLGSLRIFCLARDPYTFISISIQDVFVQIQSDSDSVIHKGIVASIENLLRQKQRKRLSTRFVLSYLIICILGNIITPFVAFLAGQPILSFLGWLFTIVSVMCSITGMLQTTLIKSEIFLYPKTESQSFVQRNRDALIVNTFVMLGTAVLATITGLIIWAVTR